MSYTYIIISSYSIFMTYNLHKKIRFTIDRHFRNKRTSTKIKKCFSCSFIRLLFPTYMIIL